MLQDIFLTLNFRIRLDSIAKATLGATKTADWIQYFEWFCNGELDKVAEYRKADVDITRGVYDFERDNGFFPLLLKVGKQVESSSELDVGSPSA